MSRTQKPQPPPIPASASGPAAPYPESGAVSWNVNTSCNYRCSYCTQRGLEDRGRVAQETERFIAAFARLPGAWEIKLSGGEPFVHPRILEIVQGVIQAGHTLSVVTNFSMSDVLLERFLSLTAGKLRVFSASLHLEYVQDLDTFIARCQRTQQALGVTGSLAVTCVATRQNLPKLQSLHARFLSEGIRFKVQPEKLDRDVIAYTPEEQTLLESLGGHNLTGALAWDFYGLPCWAGARYFILDALGEAWRCYPARRYRTEYLGNFLSPDFRLNEAPELCRYRYCSCTVPISRNMMAKAEMPLLEDV